jgi:hypothetical protein
MITIHLQYNIISPAPSSWLTKTASIEISTGIPRQQICMTRRVCFHWYLVRVAKTLLKRHWLLALFIAADTHFKKPTFSFFGFSSAATRWVAERRRI